MAYLIFTCGSQEVGRRALTGSIIIGRSPECDVSIRDITLSRRHLKLEQASEYWTAIDLESRNGTTCDGELLTRRELIDGDALRIGKTTLTFRTGKLKPRSRFGSTTLRTMPRRPVDPIEALGSTAQGIEVDLTSVPRAVRAIGARPFPQPLPRPADPAYADDDVYSMVQCLVSSSWDSIYLSARDASSQRAMPRPLIVDEKLRTRPARPHFDIDLSAHATAKPVEPHAPKWSPWSQRLLQVARQITGLNRRAA